MKIGLVSYRSENKNIPFNLMQIERALKEAQGQAELLCFGEAFLQGDVGYHLRHGEHFFSRTDWQRLMEFMEIHK